MSKYTTQVRFLVEQFADDETLTIREKIDKALPIIFNFEYPIWSESYRVELERKIIKHYFNKEIGLETFGLWQLYLDERLNLIMPYYNELYKTISLNYEWLEDINISENFDSNKTTNGNISTNNEINVNVKDTEINTSEMQGKNNNKVDRQGKNLNSDFPQGNFAGLDYGSNYLESEGNETSEDTQTNTVNANTDRTNTNNTNTTGSNQSKTDTTDLYNKVIKGLNGSRSRTQLNVEYRQSLINIDKQIIDELYDLFMLVY